MNDLAARLTSRKFLLALLSGIFGALAAAGVVPADAVARDIALASLPLFIAVEGAADIKERGKLSPATLNDIKAEVGALLAPNAAATDSIAKS